MNGPFYFGNGEARPEPRLPAPVYEKFRSVQGYQPSAQLRTAVNVALLLGQPLLVTGEPGTGKTQLAFALAKECFGGRILTTDIKSTTTRSDLLYRFDELARFRDSQPGRTARRALDYFRLEALGEAIVRAFGPTRALTDLAGRALSADDPVSREVFGVHLDHPPCLADLLPQGKDFTDAKRWVVLIDELDKAPRDTPNDLLSEVERMEFAIPELGLSVSPSEASGGDAGGEKRRPVVVITSNSERSLPEAFLRRCAYHHIEFPDERQLSEIVLGRVSSLNQKRQLLKDAIGMFVSIRQANIQKKPGTAELLVWLDLLSQDVEAGAGLNKNLDLGERYLAALVKVPEDIKVVKAVIAQRLR